MNRIQREDPEMAAAWAGSIGDENMRNNALSNVFSQWQRMDPEGARAAAAASALPDNMKQRFSGQGGEELHNSRIDNPVFRTRTLGGG